MAAALENASPEGAARAAYAAAEIILTPQPAGSNATTVLMKRAMIGQARPLLPYMDKEQLTMLRDRLARAYGRRQTFPVEKEMLKEMDKLLQ